MKLSKILFNSIYIMATTAEVEPDQETYLYEVTGCNNEDSSVSKYIYFFTAVENKYEINVYYSKNRRSR